MSNPVRSEGFDWAAALYSLEHSIAVLLRKATPEQLAAWDTARKRRWAGTQEDARFILMECLPLIGGKFDGAPAASVSYLPVWKKGATPEERFLELAAIAKAHPERFDKTVVIYSEQLPDNHITVRYITNGANSTEALGLIELGKDKLLRWVWDGSE